jgi:hypothetical protein
MGKYSHELAVHAWMLRQQKFNGHEIGKKLKLSRGTVNTYIATVNENPTLLQEAKERLAAVRDTEKLIFSRTLSWSPAVDSAENLLPPDPIAPGQPHILEGGASITFTESGAPIEATKTEEEKHSHWKMLADDEPKPVKPAKSKKDKSKWRLVPTIKPKTTKSKTIKKHQMPYGLQSATIVSWLTNHPKGTHLQYVRETKNKISTSTFWRAKEKWKLQGCPETPQSKPLPKKQPKPIEQQNFNFDLPKAVESIKAETLTEEIEFLRWWLQGERAGWIAKLTYELTKK